MLFVTFPFAHLRGAWRAPIHCDAFAFAKRPSARTTLGFYRDFTSAGIPDELTMYAGALCTPEGMPAIALIPAWCGDLDGRDRVLNPVRKFGSPVADLVARMRYPAMQQMVDGVGPFGLRSYWKAQFLRELTYEAIDKFVYFRGDVHVSAIHRPAGTRAWRGDSRAPG